MTKELPPVGSVWRAEDGTERMVVDLPGGEHNWIRWLEINGRRRGRNCNPRTWHRWVRRTNAVQVNTQ